MVIFGGLMDVVGLYNIFLLLSLLSFAGMMEIIPNKGIRVFFLRAQRRQWRCYPNTEYLPSPFYH